MTVKELQDAIVPMVQKIQDRTTELNERGAKTDETIENIKADFIAKSDLLQEHITKMEAENKQLEAMIARMPKVAGGKDDLLGDKEYRKGFTAYVRERSPLSQDMVRRNVEENLRMHGIEPSDELIIKAGLVGSNPDGGFLAPVDAARFISQRVFETSPVRQVANVISTAMSSVTVIIDDQEADTGWVGEVDARPETDTPQLAELEIPIHELYAQPAISQKAIDDISINLESWLQEKVAMKFTREENASFINGSGSKQPKGILTYPRWATQGNYERFALEDRETAVVGTISGDDFIDLQSDLLEEYQPNASWMMHRKIWSEVTQLKDDENQYLLNPMMLFAGVNMQLLGRPVRFAGDMDSTIAEGNDIAIYGDFREGYTVVDRIGIRVLRDPYTNKPYIRLYTTKRVGGAVTNFQALKILQVQAS